MTHFSHGVRLRTMLTALVVGVLCLGPVSGRAQPPAPAAPAAPVAPAATTSTDNDKASEEKAELKLESFAVPDAPAVAFINASPEQIGQPGSGRALIAQVLSNITVDGQVQQGFAVNSDLWYLLPVWAGGTIPPGAFSNPLGYAWSRLQVSLATTKTVDSPNGTEVAFGLRTTFFDESDLMRDAEVRRGVVSALNQCKPTTPPLPSEEESQQCIDKTWGELTKSETIGLGARIARAREKWNANRLSLSAATGLRLTDSHINDSQWLGASVWVNGSWDVRSKWLQLIAQARYDYQDLTRAHVLGGGVRANVGSPTFNLYAEALYRWSPTKVLNTDLNVGRWALGLEYRLMQQVWVSASLGSSFATKDAPEKVAVFSTFKWNLGDKPRYSPTELQKGFDVP